MSSDSNKIIFKETYSDKEFFEPLKCISDFTFYRIYSPVDVIIPSNEMNSINTYLSIRKILNGYYGRITSIPSMISHSIVVRERIIDIDDKMENLVIKFYNFGNVDYKISRGDVIARLICEKYYDVNSEMIFHKLNDKSLLPRKSSSISYKLYLNYDTFIDKKSIKVLPVNIRISLPKDCCARITNLSSKDEREYLIVLENIVEVGYNGNLEVTLYNFSDEKITIKEGEPIAQLICEKFYHSGVEIYNTIRRKINATINNNSRRARL